MSCERRRRSKYKISLRQSKLKMSQPDTAESSITDTVFVDRLERLKLKAHDLLSAVDDIISKDEFNHLRDYSTTLTIDYYEQVQEFERKLIRWALQEQNGSQTKAARLLNLRISTLNEMIKRYGIHSKQRRPKKTE